MARGPHSDSQNDGSGEPRGYISYVRDHCCLQKMPSELEERMGAQTTQAETERAEYMVRQIKL